MTIKFGLKIGDSVRIKLIGCRGDVRGLYAGRGGYQRYLVAYVAEQKQQEDWFDLEDWDRITPNKKVPAVKTARNRKKPQETARISE